MTSNSFTKLHRILVIGLLWSLGSDAAWAEVPQGYSDVYVQGTQLIVSKRQPDGSLGAPTPYIIKGVTWSPATRAPATGPAPGDPTRMIPYGFFFDRPDVMIFWLNEQIKARAPADLVLIQQLQANTVRTYTDLGDDVEAARAVLDQCYRHGIMVILSVAGSEADLESGRYLQIVQRYQDHPAILMWSLGNEWNFNLFFGYRDPEGHPDPDAAIEAVELAAQEIRKRDANHPVTSSLGDRFSTAPTCAPGVDPCCVLPDPHTDIPTIVERIPDVDVWGINVYRGGSFGTLVDEWRETTAKPFYLSEFGTDSFATQTYEVNEVNECGPVQNIEGEEDQRVQATFLLGLWQELRPQLSALNPAGPVVGGFVHSWNDMLWKVGNFHVQLGQPREWYDGNTSYDGYNTEGFLLPGSHPDSIGNEEYFGVVNADRLPKQLFARLQEFYGALSPPSGLAISGSIREADGIPVSGIRVLLKQPKVRRPLATTTTDAQGAYRFEDLESGSYVVKPKSVRWVFKPKQQRIELTTGGRTGVDFTARRR